MGINLNRSFLTPLFYKMVLSLGVVLSISACGNDNAKTGLSGEAVTSTQSQTNDQAIASENVTQTDLSASSPQIVEISSNAYTSDDSGSTTQTNLVKTVEITAVEKAQTTNANAVSVTLNNPTSEEIDAVKKNNAQRAANFLKGGAKAYQMGFNRAINITSNTTDGKSSQLQWTTLDSGQQLAVVKIKSPTAKGLRVGMLVQNLPDSTIFRVYGNNATSAVEVPAAHVNRIVKQNISAVGDNKKARTYWLPPVDGENLTIEVKSTTANEASNLNVTFYSLIHDTVSLEQVLSKTTVSGIGQIGTSGSCNVDATCSSPLPPAANAVALMLFIEDTSYGSYYCTGTLLGDNASTKQPYFLTANHCISSPTEASTLITEWFSRSSSCNAGTLNPSSVRLFSGAALLWHREALSSSLTQPNGTDTSFLSLYDLPPSGAVYSGWSTQRQAANLATTYTGLHHPSADLLKRSYGKISSYLAETDAGLAFSSSNTNLPYYVVNWHSGVTEPGSSGSALFLDAQSNPKVVGQLYGGYAACGSPDQRDWYGRFDLAYNAALYDWLDKGSAQAYQVRELGDFNGDGRVDTIWRLANGKVKIALMDGNLVQQWSSLNGFFSSSVVIVGSGDFNGDGKDDIVWRNMTTGNVSISIMNGGSIVSWQTISTPPIAPNVKLEAIGDFDGNGRADMLWRDMTTGRSTLTYHNANGSISSSPVVRSYIDPVNVVALKIGDINGDGKDDIVFRNMTTGNVSISLMNGAVMTSSKSITPVPVSLNVKLEGIGDFNGDGRADLVWRNQTTGRTVLSYHNPTDGTAIEWPLIGTHTPATVRKIQGIGDFNHDGKSDILWRNATTGNTTISTMNANTPIAFLPMQW